jgi:hypothetical protein
MKMVSYFEGLDPPKAYNEVRRSIAISMMISREAI